MSLASTYLSDAYSLIECGSCVQAVPLYLIHMELTDAIVKLAKPMVPLLYNIASAEKDDATTPEVMPL